MKLQSKILTGVTVATVLGVAVIAHKAHAAISQGRFAERRAERLAALGVTDDQKAQVKQILQKYQPTAVPLVKQFVAERRELRELMHAATIDEAAIRSQVAKVSQTGADLAVERAHIAHDIRAVLTTDQIAKLNEWKEDIDARLDGFLDHLSQRATE